MSFFKNLFIDKNTLILQEKQDKLTQLKSELQNLIDRLNVCNEYNRGVMAAYKCLMKHIDNYLNLEEYTTQLKYSLFKDFIRDSQKGIFNGNIGLQMFDYEKGYDSQWDTNLFNKFKSII